MSTTQAVPEKKATSPIDRAAVANNLQEVFKGKISDESLAGMKKNVTAAFKNSYYATGSYICALFYFRITIDLTSPVTKQFVGNAGGIGLPGGGGMWGDIYTDDLNALISNTVSFQFTATPVFFNVNFFDGSSNLLGTYVAGALSVSPGTGGGKGGWD
jgi:hypothetical protein